MKKILFLTGTRADFGKLKPLIQAVASSGLYEWSIFVTGMHMLSRYGFTVDEVYKAGFANIYTFMNQNYGESMEMVTANTITGLSRYMQEFNPDLIVVHGDRVEALAGAIVGSIRNILVAHIEGGELSGTVDDIIRHAVTKLSHIHFVANDLAASRLLQLGETPDTVYVIGSPDIDVMLSPDLPDLKAVRDYYMIDFPAYGIAQLHSVTTELMEQKRNARIFVAMLLESGLDYVVIYPNNDEGCKDIFLAYEKLQGNPHFKLFPSLRFEYFLTLLKNASFIIGNSSAGVREAPVYAVPSINVGSRQQNRFNGNSVINVEFDRKALRKALEYAQTIKGLQPDHYFGNGQSTRLFMEALAAEKIWNTPRQKVFKDIFMDSQLNTVMR